MRKRGVTLWSAVHNPTYTRLRLSSYPMGRLARQYPEALLAAARFVDTGKDSLDVWLTRYAIGKELTDEQNDILREAAETCGKQRKNG